MKHIKLYEQFINEARMSPAQSWLTDYFNACTQNAESNYIVELEKLKTDMLNSIKNPINASHIIGYTDHMAGNMKRNVGIAKKADKTKANLLKELPEIIKSNPAVEQAIPVAEKAAELKGKYDGLPFIRDQYEEWATEKLTTDATDLKNILKVTDAYHKEFAAGKKEFAAANSEYEKILSTL
jgi:hypothetical protein